MDKERVIEVLRDIRENHELSYIERQATALAIASLYRALQQRSNDD